MTEAILEVLSSAWIGEKRGPQCWALLRGPCVVGRFKTKKDLQRHLEAIDQAKRVLAADGRLLTNYRHPHPKMAHSEFTARDYVLFLLDHATSLSGLRRAFGLIAQGVAALNAQPLADNVIPFRPRGSAA